VGNTGSVNSLFEWLKDWDDVHIRGNKKQAAAPSNRFARGAWQDVPKVNAKAALVSGPPGIGKTSACRIICKHLGYEVMEMNASDCRSKLAIQASISMLSGNKSLDYWTVAGQKKQIENSKNPLIQALGGQNNQKSVIIMDEVDGVGAGDRGGVSALI
jgi:replication factor C subunit 1